MKALFLLLSLILAPYGRTGLSLNGEWSAIVEQGEYHIWSEIRI